jgi:hypothetical protein
MDSELVDFDIVIAKAKAIVDQATRERLKSWQDGKLSPEEAIRLCGVADIYELWELALSSSIEIKLADQDEMAAYLEGKRQIDRGEWEDMDDVIADMDRIIAGLDDDRS